MRRAKTGEEPFTLPAHYVRQIAEQVRSMGGDVKRWLADCGLTEASPASAILWCSATIGPVLTTVESLQNSSW